MVIILQFHRHLRMTLTTFFVELYLNAGHDSKLSPSLSFLYRVWQKNQ